VNESIQSGVSVIVTTYNGEKSIEKTISSVLNQSYQNIQLIVVDDGSTDRTNSILKAIANKDSRVELISLNKNSNLPAVGRNVGIRQSKFNYIAFIDHDDLWEKFKIERQIQFLNKNQSLVMAHCRLQVFTDSYFKLKNLWYPMIPDQVTKEELIEENRIQFSSVIMRKEILNTIGLFDESLELRAIEDLELWIRIASKFKIGFQNDLMGYYFFSENNTSQNEKNDIKMKRLYEKINIDLPPTQRNQIETSDIFRGFFRLLYLNLRKYYLRKYYNIFR
jgi:glycosyltransferase involved in cell wall biosynthesis